MPTTPRLFTLNAPDIAADTANITYQILAPDLTSLVATTGTGVTGQASGYTAAVAYDLSWPKHGTIRWFHSGAEVAAEAFDLPGGELDLADGIESGETWRQTMRLIRAILAGVATDSGTSFVVKRKDGTTTAATITHDDTGNRPTVTIGSL